MKIGVQLTSLQQPIKKALHTAGDLGADAVEIDARAQMRPGNLTQSGVRQLRKMLVDRNLTVCAIGFRTRRGYNVADGLDRRVEATKDAMRMAYELGANVVVNQVGRVPADQSGPDWDLLVQVLSDLGKFGQHVGAVLAAETGSEDAAALAALVEALPPGCLGINLDPANLIVNGFSASEAVRLLGPYTLHVHANDGVRDLARGRGVQTPLGRGSADFPELIGTLEESEYRGYFTVERELSSNPIGEVGQAIEYLRNL